MRLFTRPLTPLPGFGLACLPPPSAGDIFLDFEGDPFVDEGGLEFLFGYAFKDAAGIESYKADWALSRADEKAAFERFVDFVIARLEVHPDLHIYHYASYEPAALKRLMGRYATRESEIDRMLRAGVFVDLYAVVRHAIRASVESYSIKKLEPLYEFERTVGLPDAGAVLAKVQASLELGDFGNISEEERTAVTGYNRDDCLSAWRLRDWLEKVRSDLLASGAVIERPAPRSGEAGEDLSDWQQKIAGLIERLTHSVPIDPSRPIARADTPAGSSRTSLIGIGERTKRSGGSISGCLPCQPRNCSTRELASRASHLLNQLVAPARRQSIATVSRRRILIYAATKTCAGSAATGSERSRQFLWKIGPSTLRSGKIRLACILKPCLPTESSMRRCKRMHWYASASTSPITVWSAKGPTKPRAIFFWLPYLARAVRRSRERTRRTSPQLCGLPRTFEGVLPIQGPPGAGKTHIGARMICTLAQAGKSVGITANSHKVIRNALDEVLRAAPELGASVDCIQKVS